MRLAFLGTPEAAVPTLRALVAAGHDVDVVITRPDRRRGRGSATSSSPVKAAAEELGLPVAHDLGALDGLDLDYGIVVAYGAMIPGSLLERLPMLNVHFSLLPRWRGAAPVERAILAGDVETGVGIMALEVTLDTGPLHAEARTRVDDKSASALTQELALLGAELLVATLDDAYKLAHPTPQVGEATYAAKLSAETFHLAPTMSVLEASRVIRLERAFLVTSARRVRVLQADACEIAAAAGTLLGDASGVYLGLADGALRLGQVRPEGSATMSAQAWWSGARLSDGTAWA